MQTNKQPNTQSDSAEIAVSDEKRQFDFWIGTWELTWGDDQSGTNHVEAILDGQVIQENFDGQPSIPLKGISLSTYDVVLHKWRQTWVDNEGSYIDLIGEFKDNQMMLSTQRQAGDAMIQFRMIFYNITANEFDWNWERLNNENMWVSVWQIHYRRKR